MTEQDKPTCGNVGSLGTVCDRKAGHSGDHWQRRAGKGMVGWFNHGEPEQPRSVQRRIAEQSECPHGCRSRNVCAACGIEWERARVRQIIEGKPVPMCPDAASDSWESGWDAALEWALAALDEGANDE